MLKRTSRLNVLFRTLLFTARIEHGSHFRWCGCLSSIPSTACSTVHWECWGFRPARWINEPATALPSLAAITIWRMLGYSTVVYLGGIQNISEDVLEAATIDRGQRHSGSVAYYSAPGFSYDIHAADSQLH